MRTSLKKLRGFYKHGNSNTKNNKDRKDLRALAQLDELSQASQDMQDMRDCYDSLLSAAAATMNSSYEFSESLRFMGACLLEKTALNDDEDGGRVLLMLGKVQYEIQKFVDNYRSNISRTITVPSESLLNELRTVEEMKRQCDEKREVYEYMKSRVREKGKLKSGKGESFSVEQLKMARDEYDEEATLFIFRLKSLKQGQSRSLLTQAARHHAAQLCFFKKALSSLEVVEPQVKLVTEQQHIDYHFCGLQDDDSDDYNDFDSDCDDDDDSYDSNDDGELSFDYGQNYQERDIPASKNSMEVDQVDLTFPMVGKVEDYKTKLDQRPLGSLYPITGAKTISQSAPIMAYNKTEKPDFGEKLRQSQPSLTRKFHSYVLPTPLDTKTSVSIGSGNPTNQKVQTSLSERTQNLWHSTPLEPRMYEKIMTGTNVSKDDNKIASNWRYDQFSGSDSKKIKRQAFSGPIISKPWPTKPVTVNNNHQLFSGPLLRNPTPQKGTSPIFSSSPKISELHELPRPPLPSSRPSGLVGYSGPLVSSSQFQSFLKAPTKSPLPKPPQIVPRSFSIPSSGLRIIEDLASPPLSPITIAYD